MSISNLLVANDLDVFVASLTLPSSGNGTIDYYEQFTEAAALGGIWAANQPCAINITRIGNLVTFMLEGDILATANTASTIQLVLTGGIPARFRPVTDFHGACLIQNNGTVTAAGVLLISAAGVLQISNTGGTNFTGSGTSGTYGFAVSYLNS